ncbi:hypothetical protein [Alsobacter sp. SYSU BS001988]|jgi:hypothetical protein
MISPRILTLQALAAGALLVGGLAGAQAAPLPPMAAAPVAHASEGLATTVQWGPGYGYYGHPRRHYWGGGYGYGRPYYGPPRWGGPRCRVVRRWDPYFGGFRVTRRCW